MDQKKFYITTPIYYPSDKLHIGHTYCTVATDAMARYKRLQGYNVKFLTGTDEHGQKIELKAKEAGVTPQQFVDNIVEGPKGVKDLWKLMNISYDRFIRTTDDYHVAAIQKIFKKMYEKGDIYKGKYVGKYCTPCESFWTESQLVNGCCPDCGRPVVDAEEEAYFFRLSKYADRVRDLLVNTDFLLPRSRVNEMVHNFIDPGLEDLCVSRTSFKWGIPVDFDPKHVVYVWIDALSNYITALGYDPDGSSELFNKYWPADAHIIGKDILRFHTIYWPIMLMALGLELPKKVFGHPWLLFGTDKMSKSKGNVIYADDLVRHFGVDAIRYYLLSEMPYAADGSITYTTIIERYNSELANTLGNLVNRTIAMSNKYFGGEILAPEAPEAVDEDLKNTVLGSVKTVDKCMDDFHVADALEAIFSAARRSNKYIDETTPWLLAKDEDKRARLGTVLYNLLESIRIIAVQLKPFMPDTSDKILEQLNTDISSYESIQSFGALKAGVHVGTATPLFNRIDAEKMLEEIEKETSVSEAVLEEKKGEIPGVTMIGIDDFAKVELKVAKIKDCVPVKRAKKLLELTIDDGSGLRTVASGIAKWYKPEDLVGHNIILVSNLKPAKLCGVESCGMILAATCGEEIKVIFVDDMEPGSKIS